MHENPHDDSMVIIDDVPKTNQVDSEPNHEDDFDSVSMTNSYKYVKGPDGVLLKGSKILFALWSITLGAAYFGYYDQPMSTA